MLVKLRTVQILLLCANANNKLIALSKATHFFDPLPINKSNCKLDETNLVGTPLRLLLLQLLLLD